MIQYLPLGEAVKLNDLEMVKILVEAGATDSKALSIAASNKCREIFDYLLAHSHRHDFPEGKYLTMPLLQIVGIQDADTDIVKTMINAGADVNGSVLSHAIPYNGIDVIKMLFDAGASASDALAAAAKNNQRETFDYLLANTPHLDFPEGEYGLTPLMAMIRIENVDIAMVHALIKAGANANAKQRVGNKYESVLYQALSCFHINSSLIKMLIDASAEVNEPEFNLLEVAMRHPDHIKLLLDAGADPDRGNIILKAATDHEWETVKLLIAAGADATVSDTRNSVKKHAQLDGQDEILELLKDVVSDLDLIMAVKAGDLESVRFAIDKGADINAHDAYGQTSLMNAAYLGHTAIAACLIASGADLEAGKDGETALTIAVNEGYEDIATALAKAGAEPDAANENGMTRLMFIASGDWKISRIFFKGDSDNIFDMDNWEKFNKRPIAQKMSRPEQAKLLLALGAKIDIRDDKGNSAFNYAEQAGQTEIADILIQAGTSK